MELSLSDKEKKLSGKPWHLLKRQTAAGKGKWRRGFMVMLAPMEAHFWLTTSNWKLTSRSTWKDFIRYWSFGISEKMCAPIHLMEMTLRYQLSGQEDACVHEKNSCLAPVHGSVLEVVRYFRPLLWQSISCTVASVTPWFLSQNDFSLMGPGFIKKKKVKVCQKEREADDNVSVRLLFCWSNICFPCFAPKLFLQ